MPISLKEKNEMEWVWKAQKGKLKDKKYIFPKKSGNNQEVPMSRKRGYMTITLPQDFWQSILRKYLDVPVLRGRVFLIIMAFERP